MTTYSPAPRPNRGSGRSRWMALAAALVALVFASQVLAQAPAASGGVAMVPSAETLDKLVGRIALYPDDLVAVILPASTFPLEIVQAERYLQKRKTDPKLPYDEKWDDSVKTLLNYPDVVKTMSDDLDWTSDLGEAVVADQGAVLEAIQVFRRRTQSVGNLKSDDKQTVVVEKEVITIVPANPQVIYVPTYNPSTVVVTGGYSSYGYYPAPYPSYYYPYAPGAALATGLVFGAAMGAAWSGGRYGASYSGGGNTINIDNSKSANRSSSTSSQRSGSAGSSSGQWKSNKQPGQVSSGSGRSQSARVGDTGSRGGAGGAAGGARPSAQPAGGASNRGGGGGAFDSGGASGRQTQMDSSRGASSRASSPSASTRQSSGSSARSSGASAGARSSGASAGARSSGGGGRSGGGRR